MRLATRILHRLIRRWQWRCEHDPQLVRADILMGCGTNTTVSWCPTCGAYRVKHIDADGSHWGEWHAPRADFKAWLDMRSVRRLRQDERLQGH